MFTQFIKPASPTPSHLKRYNLSSIDQFTPRAYIPIVFYYPNCVSNGLQDNADKSSRLNCSLSEILIHFYPFAGRLNSTTYVDCNDEGVEFQEVNMKCGLSEILEKPADEAMGLVFPAGLVWGDLNTDSSLLVIRLSHFKCGGISIAVCLSHKLGDAQTFSTFMNYWAVKMRANTSCDDALLSPHFISTPRQMTMGKESGSKNITRVEVLSALLWKCAMAATASNSSSLCRMEFYQVDFGWGNPSRVTLADAPGKNNFFLMDTPDGDGIAAVVYDVGIPIKSPKIAPFLTLKACMSVCRQMRVLGYKNGENRVKISTTRLQDRSWGSQDRSWELSAKTFVSHNINFICVLPSQTPEMLESLLRPNTKVVEENDMELLA
ncbi:hypothetical protein LguiA_004609 [Lonicera macranthoides]